MPYSPPYQTIQDTALKFALALSAGSQHLTQEEILEKSMQLALAWESPTRNQRMKLLYDQHFPIWSCLDNDSDITLTKDEKYWIVTSDARVEYYAFYEHKRNSNQNNYLFLDDSDTPVRATHVLRNGNIKIFNQEFRPLPPL